MDFVNTKSFPLVKSTWLLSTFVIVASVMVSGCSPELISTKPTDGADVLNASDARITDRDQTSRLDMRINGGAVRVGQLAETVFEDGYRRPPKSTLLTELPPGFDAGFTSQGWETPKRHFSVVIADERVVLALDHWDDIETSDAQIALEQTITLNGKPDGEVGKGTVRYYFWNDGNVRLMVVVDQGEKPTKLTMAIGLSKLLDSLRMDPASAVIDTEKAEKQYAEPPETNAKN